jgi:inorganic pyrophosphatase
MEDKAVDVYIEIERGSDQKYEWNRETGELELDRVLNAPHTYPYAYGFIPQTFAEDGDELDVLVIDNEFIPRSSYKRVYIVGALLMEDEHGKDEKLLTVPEDVFASGEIRELADLSSTILESIQTFFANYKQNDPDRWSKVYGFANKEHAVSLYDKYRVANMV